jgi:hypothetical protein
LHSHNLTALPPWLLKYCYDAAHLAKLRGGSAREVQPAGQEALLVDKHVGAQLRLQLLRSSMQNMTSQTF